MSSPPIPKLLRESSDLTITSASTPSTTTSTTTIIPTNNVTYTRAHRKPSTKLTTLLNPFRKCTPRQKQKSRRKHNYNFQLSHQPLFRNSLLAGVGFLELANAADFAANVWNQIPVPKYAMVFMAIGGPIALLITIVAARDFYLSYTNVQLLLKERRYLRELLDSITTTTTTTTTNTTTQNPTTTTHTQAELLLRSRLSVNFRELGTEIVDRILMDALMGFGALLVGTGTIMAIFGANHHVYVASNLLSGYIGNGLAAVFGLVNAIWSGYLVGRFQVCWRSCQNITSTSTSTATMPTRDGNGNNNPHPGDEEDTCIEEVRMYHHPLKLRFRSLQFHALVNGINGLVAGAASMVTATMWYGYVVLVPCIVSLIACNWFWRVRVGYDRPLLSSSTTSASLLSTTGGRGGGGGGTATPTTTTNANGGGNGSGGIGNEKTDLLLDLSSATHLHRMLASSTKDSGIQLPRHILNRTNPSSVMSFLTRNGMFEGFCVWIDHDKSLERGVEDLLDLESITSSSSTTSPGGKNNTNNNNNNEKPNEENNNVNEEKEGEEESVELSLTADDFLTLARHDTDILLRKMNEYLDGNVVRAVAYRERFLLEVLGVVVYLESIPKDEGDEVERKRRWWFGCL
ncbi:hypothetical protein BO79DRAFT_209726 [Aspergillus costaricaensis CBS 115574]|uniref:Uncharacterized protein n=1 Tax=Aspergillus costaricaensis CBS 115574 TaxID=1448317 RepID=A0ACD1IB01_9EURO|nr:hypothetical protein BO79DRAFT_209726 [Aspergillus costaricaensis CBS 115574]RAK87702.1 hypothetical protein BO79DRAFT_209726 [Aspergillus costaricaensis CBS 115574]